MEAEGLADGVEEADADGEVLKDTEPEAEALGLLDADGDTEEEATSESSYSLTNSTNGMVISLTTFE